MVCSVKPNAIASITDSNMVCSVKPNVMSNIYYANCEIQVVNDLDAKMKAKYMAKDKAYAALV